MGAGIRNVPSSYSNQDFQAGRTFSLDDLVRYFPTRSGGNCIDVEATFRKWGHVLSSAKKLREDSNYEGLLITHEYNHVKVTDAFENLVRVFSQASETVLAEAISLMKIFVNVSQRREHWYAFLNWKEEREGLTISRILSSTG